MTSQPLALLLWIYFLGITSFTALTALLALYFEREFAIGAEQMGILFAISGGCTVLVRGVALGRLVKRYGEIATVRVGAISLALAFVLIPLMQDFRLALAAVPLYAFGAGTLFPSLATLTSLATDADSQGSILGGSQVVGGLGRVVGPLWAGLLFQEVAPRTPFHVALGLTVIAILLAQRIPRRLQSADEVAETVPAETAQTQGPNVDAAGAGR
jgi:MFS family permease